MEEERGRPAFSTSFRGYEPAEVDAHLEERRRVERELEEALEALRLRNAELEREQSRLQGELDGLRAALPELEDRVEQLRMDYERRLRALDALVALSARELAERGAVRPRPEADKEEPALPPASGEPPRGRWTAPED